MQQNKTIKIFLASSNELKCDRYAFGNLVRKLDKIYEKRGVRIDLFEWEDNDAAYNNHRKQDEYNDQVRASDMFLALFHKKAGKFTIEEFEIATEEFRRTGIKPKNYVYCRELQDGEQESAELAEFKRRLFDEMGHYWCNYNNEDSLQLHFFLQLQLVENNQLEELKVENGEVTFDDMTVACMDNLRFVATNPDYQRIKQRLVELPLEIEDARVLVYEHPEIERYRDKLQKLLNERNKLQEVFDQQQNLLLSFAKRIARLQGEQITDRMRRAIEAFERGDVHEANIILDEAEKDGDIRFAVFERKEEIRQIEIQSISKDIDGLLLQVSVVMADVEQLIKDRIDKAVELYKKADHRALRINYDKKKYSILLLDYARFMYNYGLYQDAETAYLRLINIAEELFGKEHGNTAAAYNNIGLVYKEQGKFDKALEYCFKALTIKEKVLGVEHPETASSYNNIGLVYNEQGNYSKALKYYFKALVIKEKILGMEHPSIATSYNNIGTVYADQGDYVKALEYNFKALEILERSSEEESTELASYCNNIGTVYCDQGDYEKALEYQFKALSIMEKVLGTEHPSTATAYNSIGLVYYEQGNYKKALEYVTKAYLIREKTLGSAHPDTKDAMAGINFIRMRTLGLIV